MSRNKNGGAAVAIDTSSENVFKIGDKVVYPSRGVGSVDDIETLKVGGSEQSFYKITILESPVTTVRVPVGQEERSGLRCLADRKTIDKVYEILKERNVVVDRQTWNRRHREYLQKIKTGSVFEIATVIRDLSVLKTDKELSFGERRMLEQAQGLLVKEISIAKSSTEDNIKRELQALFERRAA